MPHRQHTTLPTASPLAPPSPASATDVAIPLCSPNPLVQQTLAKLLLLGCPPLPIAPRKEPSATLTSANLDQAWLSGKNPSFLGRDGRPYLVRHRDFHEHLPTWAQLQRFFAHPDVGIATLGGHQGLVWLDFDAKCYPSQSACEAEVEQVLERILAQTDLTLSGLWVEQTGGGGYRLPLRPRRLPTFTKFATTPGGAAVGEILGHGQCAVLAPTQHPNGSLYRVLQAGFPAAVESLAAVGLYPVTPPPVARPSSKTAPLPVVPASLRSQTVARHASTGTLAGRVSRAWGVGLCPVSWDGDSSLPAKLLLTECAFRVGSLSLVLWV